MGAMRVLMNDLMRDWKSWTKAEQVIVTLTAIVSLAVVAAGLV
jgi:hypothetical protein